MSVTASREINWVLSMTNQIDAFIRFLSFSAFCLISSGFYLTACLPNTGLRRILCSEIEELVLLSLLHFIDGCQTYGWELLKTLGSSCWSLRFVSEKLEFLHYITESLKLFCKRISCCFDLSGYFLWSDGVLGLLLALLTSYSSISAKLLV